MSWDWGQHTLNQLTRAKDQDPQIGITHDHLYRWYNWYHLKWKTLFSTLWLRLKCLYDQEISLIKTRKRATRPCIMTSPLHQAHAIHLEEGVILIQDLLCDLVLGLALAWAAGATTTPMWLKMTASQVRSPMAGTCTPQRVTMEDIYCPDKSGTVFVTFSTPIAKKGKCTQK